MMASKSTIEQLTINREQEIPTFNNKWYLTSFAIVTIFAVVWYVNGESNKQPLPSLQVSTALVEKTDTIAVNPVNANQEIETLNSNKDEIKQKVLDASGHIVARRVATVSSKVTGKLEGLHIEEGLKVKQNQILAEVDDVQANLAYQRSLANLAAAKASYSELLVLKKYEEKRLSRQQELNKNQLISEQLTEDSEMRISQLDAQIKNKMALIELNESNVALAKYELEQHKIRAPFDGVVISKNAQVGELISAGNSGGSIRTGVGTIVDMSSLEIEVEVNESYINRVSAGQQVSARLDAYPEWKIPSEVIAVIPTADRQKASIKVRIKLLDIDHRVLPDMGVRVSFIGTNQHNELIAAAH